MSATATAYLDQQGTLFATPTAKASATAWSATPDPDDYLHGYMEAGTARAGASAGSYTGADVGVDLFKYGHDHGEMKLALGLDTGVGIKDKSLVIKVLGCGITVGDQIGFSFLGSEAKGKGFFGMVGGWFS